MAEQRQNLATRLLNWYDQNARVLPWRAPAGTKPEPYKVWLSEIMLQQTTVAAVKDYFLKFITIWPAVQDLAKADREDVMRAWAGLGYYARARNLHACAQQISDRLDGHFPQTIEGLLELPGVGPYTAAAIAAIAFEVPAAAVDGNVERVISRHHAIEVPLPASKPLIKEKAQALVPEKRAGDFAQGLMDLGATICTPKSPQCPICPWGDDCLGRQQGIAATLPRKQPKKKIPTRRAYAFWIECDGKVLLRQRPDQGLLGGMLEIPSTEWQVDLPADYTAPVKAQWKKHPGQVEHTFTHFHLQLTVLQASLKRQPSMPADCRWVAYDDLGKEALPSVMRKVVAHIMR